MAYCKARAKFCQQCIIAVPVGKMILSEVKKWKKINVSTATWKTASTTAAAAAFSIPSRW